MVISSSFSISVSWFLDANDLHLVLIFVHMSHCSYVYITICLEKVNTVFKCFVNWELVKYIGKIHELPEHAIHMSRCKVSGCEFSTKSDEWFSSWRGRLQSTSMSTIGWRGHRVRFPPAFQHFSRKYQHPPTNIFDMAPHTPGVLRFGKLSKKPVAPAGYKNKQCRKQTSVP